MESFWHVLWICAVVVPVTLLWVAIVIELFRRRDLSGLARVAWLVFILIVPVIGSIVYLAVTWRQAGTKRPVAAPALAGESDGDGQPAARKVST